MAQAKEHDEHRSEAEQSKLTVTAFDTTHGEYAARRFPRPSQWRLFHRWAASQGYPINAWRVSTTSTMVPGRWRRP